MGRFLKRTQLAQLFLAIGQAKIAESILEDLTGFIDRHHLEDWESGEMLAHPLALLFRCCDGDKKAEEKQRLYARICRLHPLQAYSVGASR